MGEKRRGGTISAFFFFFFGLPECGIMYVMNRNWGRVWYPKSKGTGFNFFPLVSNRGKEEENRVEEGAKRKSWYEKKEKRYELLSLSIQRDFSYDKQREQKN